MKKFLLAVILMVIPFSGATALDTPFSFLRYISGARAGGLSGSFVAIENDATALHFNPATISTVEDKQISVTFLKHVLDVNSGNFSYIYHTEDKGTLAGFAGYTNYGSFDYADNLGYRSGQTFSANDVQLGAAYSNELDSNFYYGVALKYIYSGIEDVNASAMAADVGLFYLMPDRRTNIGASIMHAGFQLSKIDGETESLPLDMRIGINHRLRGLPLLVNFSFHHLADATDEFLDRFKSFNIGGEFYLGEYVQVRLGYDNQVRNLTDAEADKSFTGFSGGLGITANNFNIDYGLTSYGGSAQLHRFSFGFDMALFK